MQILQNAGAGNGTAYDLHTGGRTPKENIRTVYCWGTFNGATVTVEVSPDGGATWFAVSGLSFTSQDAINMEVRASQVRGVVTGGTSPSINMLVI